MTGSQEPAFQENQKTPHGLCDLNSEVTSGGTWVVQGVKASAFGSGHDLRVLGSSPASGSLLGREPASSSPLSACLSAYL